MARKYIKLHKREKYSEYANKSAELTAQLKSGELNQEQFNRAHENLDEKYAWIKSITPE